MGHGHASLVRQMQEVLRGEAMRDDVREHVIAQLRHRIQRLHDRDARFAHVVLSRHFEAWRPSAMTA